MGRLKKNDVEGQKLVEERKNICKNLGISYGAYMARLRRGWSQEEADNMLCNKSTKLKGRPRLDITA